MNFTKRLIEVRKMRDLNQKELAKLVGLPPSSISHFESGRRKPSFNNLIKLTDKLSCSIDYLLGKVDTMKAAGPQISMLIDNCKKLSKRDLEVLADIAEKLANKKG